MSNHPSALSTQTIALNTYLLETENELIATLRREVLISEEVRDPFLVLLGTISVLLRNMPHNRLLHACELSMESLPACLHSTLAFTPHRLANTDGLPLMVYLGLRYDVISEPAC